MMRKTTVIYGPEGSGKTKLANALARDVTGINGTRVKTTAGMELEKNALVFNDFFDTDVLIIEDAGRMSQELIKRLASQELITVNRSIHPPVTYPMPKIIMTMLNVPLGLLTGDDKYLFHFIDAAKNPVVAPESPGDKPPLGLRPRAVVAAARIQEILAAMTRYSDAGKLIPDAWIDELREFRCEIYERTEAKAADTKEVNHLGRTA